MTDLQRTDEWHRHRLGKVTASSLHKVLAKTKSGPAAVREEYLTQLVLERTNGVPTKSFVNKAMLDGIEREPQARGIFTMETGLLVTPCGFIDHPTIKNFGASPDGLVGDDAIVEIKCPTSVTHRKYRKSGGVPKQHWPQVQAQLMCTGRKLAHFVSFDPDHHPDLMYFHATMEFAPKYVSDLEKEIIKFLAEVDAAEAEDLAEIAARRAA